MAAPSDWASLPSDLVRCVADWASLPSDLVRCVADLFLATCDVDYCISLRGVCRNWRAATDDPRGPDPRFSPRRWVLVTSLAGGDGQTGRRCLFLHVDTGRFLWKDVPMPRDYTCVASAEDGHLVLESASRSSRICLLNPITGRLVRFPVTPAQFLGLDKELGLRDSRRMFVLAAGCSSTSPMVLYSLFDSTSGGCIDLTWDAVFNRESLFKAMPALGTFAAMVPFKGRAYAVNNNGSTIAVVEHNCRLDEKPELTTIVTGGFGLSWMQSCRAFLVDNAGELLLVRLLASEVQLFKVDVENGVLEQIKSVGSRAIFLGEKRCLSVDAYNLPSIECNSIYYIAADVYCRICVHRLNDGSHMALSEPFLDEFLTKCPNRLERILLAYACFDIQP